MTRFSSMIAAITLAVVPAAASAATVNATLNGVGLNQVVSVKYNNADYSVYAGALQWSAPSGSAMPTSFSTFCIEFTQSVGFGSTYTYDVLSGISNAPYPYANPTGTTGMASSLGLLTSRNKETLIRQLWARFYASTKDGVNSTDTAGTYTDSIETAAFQVAIWKTLYETSSTVADQTSLASGNLKLNNGGLVGSKAESYLSWLRTNDLAVMANGLQALSSATAQDQMYYNGSLTTTSVAAVPLPASVMSGGALLGLMALSRARRK